MTSKANGHMKLVRGGSSGFSLPVAIITGFILLIGSLALASRSNLGIFGSIYLNQSAEAKDAAETGLAYFVAELNLPRNRWLLVKRDTKGEPDPGLWQNRSSSAKIVELRKNPCLIDNKQTPNADKAPRYSQLDPDNATTTTYKKWYINSSGAISSSATNAVKSFRLIGVERPNYASDTAEQNRTLSIWRDRTDSTPGVNKVVLRVEGQSYRNGTIIASSILEQELELTPKCCNSTFGGAHGNADYQLTATRESICFQNFGMGLLAGAANTNTGSIIVKGAKSEFTEGGGDILDNIYCLASNTAGCAINVNNQIETGTVVIDYTLKPAFSYCDKAPASACPEGTAPTPGTLTTKNITSTTRTDFASVYKASGSGSFNTSPLGNKDTVVINANASTAIPSYCSSDTSTMYCNIGKLDYQNTNVIFETGNKKLMLFFPSSGNVIDQSGNESMLHCSTATLSNSAPISCSTTRSNGENLSITDLSLFGSNTALNPQQKIELGGTSGADLNLFVYFPTAQVELMGNPDITGIIWTDDLYSAGSPSWTVPLSGLPAVYALMGMTDPTSGNTEPPFYDFTLRATNRYRWIGE